MLLFGVRQNAVFVLFGSFVRAPRTFTCSTSHNLTPLLLFMSNCYFLSFSPPLSFTPSRSHFYRPIVFSCVSLCVNVLYRIASLFILFFINLYPNKCDIHAENFVFICYRHHIYLSVAMVVMVMVWGAVSC